MNSERLDPPSRNEVPPTNPTAAINVLEGENAAVNSSRKKRSYYNSEAHAAEAEASDSQIKIEEDNDPSDEVGDFSNDDVARPPLKLPRIDQDGELFSEDDDDDEVPVLPESLKSLDFSKPKEELINEMNPEDSHIFREADSRRIRNDRAVRLAHAKLMRAKTEAIKAQLRFEESERAYQEIKAKTDRDVLNDADDLLLEPSSWNMYYNHLKIFYEREGHCNFKRTITDADVAGLTEEAEKELRTLSWWTIRQRKYKRRGELEQYKAHLLNRLNFEWNPHAGPGPEKWLKSYNLLKKYGEINGHLKVPIKYVDEDEGGFKLGSWLKTQITHYRNAKEGRQPALSAERIKLLDDLGICWGEKRLTTSWDSRLEDLLEFKCRFGHVNVPWQWKENIPLAQWVNSQRKKYKELSDGKRSNLTEDQICRLNEIGFKWSTGGRGRYTHVGEASADKNPVRPGEEPNTPEAAAISQSNVYATAPNQPFNEGQMGIPGQQAQYPNFFNPQFMRDQYMQRMAHPNPSDFSYMAYAYQMNQLNNQFNHPSNQAQPRGQMNQMFGGGHAANL